MTHTALAEPPDAYALVVRVTGGESVSVSPKYESNWIVYLPFQPARRVSSDFVSPDATPVPCAPRARPDPAPGRAPPRAPGPRGKPRGP